jgi:thiol-disulfide isomerase/thioredoxin
MVNKRRKQRLLKRRPPAKPNAPGTGKPKVQKEKAPSKKEAKPAEAKKGPSAEMVFPSEPGTGGDEKFKSWDNDNCMGKKAPSLASLDYCDIDYPKPSDGKPYVLLFWAQYHKPGYEFVKRYSLLADTYRDQIGFVAVFIDPEKANGQKFIDDPAKKYSSKFPLKMATGHDAGQKLKKTFADDLLLSVLSVPHSFLVGGDGTILWHQDHSELGATVPQWMHLFESQLAQFLATGKVNKVGEKAESESEGSDSDGEGGAVDVDLDDLF